MYKKIDIYTKKICGYYKYETSTNASRTCKEAKEKFCTRFMLDKSQVLCKYATVEKVVRTHYYNTKLPQKGCGCRLCMIPAIR